MKKNVSSQRTQFIMMFFAFATGMILSNLLSNQNMNRHVMPLQDVLFIYKGIEKNINDVNEKDKKDIEELKEKKIALIEKAALRQYFSDEAVNQGVDIETVVKMKLNWEDISDSEIDSFYLLNKTSIGKPLFKVKADIKKTLKLKKARLLREKLLNDLKAKGDLVILPRS